MENCGIFSRWLSRPINPMAVPSEAKADSSGSTMANSEPKTSRSTTPARMMPRPVPPNDCLSADSATCPATATCRWGPVAVWAAATNFWATEIGMFWASLSKVTVAKAVVPSLLICVGPRGP